MHAVILASFVEAGVKVKVLGSEVTYKI